MSGDHGLGRVATPWHPFDPTTRCRATGTRIAEGVLELDTMLAGGSGHGRLPHRGRCTLLVETGSQSSVPALLAHLDRLGLAPTTWPVSW